jgi:hypothetical protein
VYGVGGSDAAFIKVSKDVFMRCVALRCVALRKIRAMLVGYSINFQYFTPQI